MKKLFGLIAIAAVALSAAADTYTTAGNGTEWNFAKLAEVEGSQVTAGEQAGTYILSGTLVIAAGDSFVMDDGVTILMGQNAELDLEGIATMAVTNGSTFTRLSEGVVPRFIYAKSEQGAIAFRNIHFEYAGLKQFSGNDLTVDNCTFRYHEASLSNGSGAISIGGTGNVVITRSTFEYNKRSGVAGAANSTCNVTIDGCRFYYNDQQNVNYPQINLTAGPEVIIENNTVIGDRTKTRGGGIVVSDLQGIATDPVTYIRNNYVTDNRFGISVYSGQTAYITNNTLINNNTDTNPNTGGSGINVTDAGRTQTLVATGNYISGHFWGVSVIGGKNINFGRTDVGYSDPDFNPGLNTFADHMVGDVHYDFYNNSDNTVYAMGNFWKCAATGESTVDDLITDAKDNKALGEVIYRNAPDFDLNSDGNVNAGDVTILYDNIINTPVSGSDSE